MRLNFNEFGFAFSSYPYARGFNVFFDWRMIRRLNIIISALDA